MALSWVLGLLSPPLMLAGKLVFDGGDGWLVCFGMLLSVERVVAARLWLNVDSGGFGGSF